MGGHLRLQDKLTEVWKYTDSGLVLSCRWQISPHRIQDACRVRRKATEIHWNQTTENVEIQAKFDFPSICIFLYNVFIIVFLTIHLHATVTSGLVGKA